MAKTKRDPATMPGAAINAELDRLDRLDSALTSEFIATGRGSETARETLAKNDPLALRYIAIQDRYYALHAEMKRRYGPNIPHRLPRGFGPVSGSYAAHIKRNPVRVGKRAERAARVLVKRYGSTRRAREVAGGLIGTRRGAQREHFVKVRKALNPRSVFPILLKRAKTAPWKTCLIAHSKSCAMETARALQKKGYYVRVDKT